MDTATLGVIAEVVGSVAIIVSLFYLASQIRQNTRSTRSATYQSIVSHAATGAWEIIRNPDLTELLMRGATNVGDLKDGEQIRFSLLMSSWLRHYDNVYYHYRTGLVDRSQWEGFEFYLSTLVTAPGTMDWWEKHSQAFSPEFRTLVAGLMSKGAGGIDADAV